MMPSDLRAEGGGPHRQMNRYQSLVPRRRPSLKLLVLLAVAGVVFVLSPAFTAVTTLFEAGVDYSETIQKIRDVRYQLEYGWPRTPFASYRPFTLTALDRLASCLETNTCGPGEKTVIILGSFHFGNSQTGHTSGEDIWAGSLVSILELQNYTLLFTYAPLESLIIYKALSDFIPLVMMESKGTAECLALGSMNWAEATAAKPAIDGIELLDPKSKLGCAKRVGFEEGIPLHKIRTFHFWQGARHPLPSWTLSPENYTGWWGDSGNYYLGYHLEHCRHVPSALTHDRRAFILGKRPLYFTPEKYAWPADALVELTKNIGSGFEFVGGAGKAGVDQMPIGGIRNLGGMKKEEWNLEVAKSSVMLGVGSPPLSPSPYDAWCLGVPFINPIMRRDKKNPEDRHKWLTQHDALRDFDEPYVYHVWKEDTAGLKRAIESAIKTPFPPFIPDRMQRDSVESRLLHLIHHNWTEEVEGMIRNGTAIGYAQPDQNMNMEDGLLL